MTGLFRYSGWSFARELGLWFVALLWCIPFYVLVTVSLQSSHQSITQPMALPSPLKFGNYSTAWHGTDGITLGRGLINSLVITGVSVIALVVIGSLAGYALARRADRVSKIVYTLLIAGILLPVQLVTIPAYTALRTLGLVGDYAGLILLDTALLLPLTIFIYTGFVRSLPTSYEEAAFVDGASPARTYLRIVFPLLRPATGTVAILTGIIIWNDFFNPLLFLSGTANQTLPLLVYSFVGSFTTNYTLIFAAVVISIAPVLAFFIFAQRNLIRGFSGGIKA